MIPGRATRTPGRAARGQIPSDHLVDDRVEDYWKLASKNDRTYLRRWLTAKQAFGIIETHKAKGWRLLEVPKIE